MGGNHTARQLSVFPQRLVMMDQLLNQIRPQVSRQLDPKQKRSHLSGNYYFDIPPIALQKTEQKKVLFCVWFLGLKAKLSHS